MEVEVAEKQRVSETTRIATKRKLSTQIRRLDKIETTRICK